MARAEIILKQTLQHFIRYAGNNEIFHLLDWMEVESYEERINIDSWAELACIGDVYETDKIIVTIID